MVSIELSHGVLEPDDLRLVRDVFEHITTEPWFSKGSAYRSEFAAYVLDTYMRNLTSPERLEEVCRAAAWQRFRPLKSEVDGYRFLVVEDEFLIAMDAGDTLAHLGAQVLGPVSTVAEAMHLIEHGPEIDGAMLDINLNDEMSYAAAALLKMKKIPFAFVSGYDEPTLPASHRSAMVFSKPADWANVAIHLARANAGRPSHGTSVLHVAS